MKCAIIFVRIICIYLLILFLCVFFCSYVDVFNICFMLVKHFELHFMYEKCYTINYYYYNDPLNSRMQYDFYACRFTDIS